MESGVGTGSHKWGHNIGRAVTRRHWIVIGPTLGERKEGNREVGLRKKSGREEINQTKIFFVAIREI